MEEATDPVEKLAHEWAPSRQFEEFHHHGDVEQRHHDFVSKALRVALRLKSLESTKGLLIHPIKSAEVVRSFSFSGNPENVVQTLIPASPQRKKCIDVGLIKAFFVPGSEVPDLSKGLPSKTPPFWTKLRASLSPSDTEDVFHIPLIGCGKHLKGSQGTLILKPTSTADAYITLFSRLRDFPQYFPIESAIPYFSFPEESVIPPAEFSHPMLSDEQAEACGFHISNPWTSIWGPPGTGKSSALRAVCGINLDASRSTMVLATANDALDAVAEKVCLARNDAHNPQIKRAIDRKQVIRFGSSGLAYRYECISEAAIKKATDQDDFELEPKLGFSTLHRFLSCLKINGPQIFDTIVIEEAGMICPPIIYGLACMARKKVLVCGDPQQVPPVFEGGLREFPRKIHNAWSTDIFRTMGFRLSPDEAPDQRISIFTTQYRFTERILDYVNLTRLYRDYRCPSPPRTLSVSEFGAKESFPLPGQEVVVVDTSALEINRPDKHVNQAHIDVGVRILQTLLHNAGGFDIGVTMPYAAQAAAYRRWLCNANVEGVRANTVNGFQGDECPYLIYDTVEGPGNPALEYSPRGVHFLTDDNKNPKAIHIHNVALTRSKSKLVILAHREHIEETFPPNSYLRRLVYRAQEIGDVVCARELGLHTAHKSNLPPPKWDLNPKQFIRDDFYALLKQDAANARSTISIASASADPEYIPSMVRHLSEFCTRASLLLHIYLPLNSKKIKAVVSDVRQGSPWAQFHSIKLWSRAPVFVCFDDAVVYSGEHDDSTAPLCGVIPPLCRRIFMER